MNDNTIQRYVLTKRGKILVVALAMILIILPSLMLLSRVLIWNTPSNGSIDGSNAVLQSGADSSAPGLASEAAHGSQQDILNDNNTGPASINPSLAGPIAFDIDAGTMTFLYTPSLQSALDDETASLIGQLLTSPQNSNDSNIAVEIPQLPEDDTAVLTTVILNAFINYNVPLSDITFFVYQPEPDAETYEINISIK